MTMFSCALAVELNALVRPAASTTGLAEALALKAVKRVAGWERTRNAIPTLFSRSELEARMNFAWAGFRAIPTSEPTRLKPTGSLLAVLF